MSEDTRRFKDDTHRLGYEFEKHVIGLLGKEFKIISWMQDGLRQKKEVDFCPDLTVEHLPTGEKFGMECKFRSSLYQGSISWAKEYQLGKYDRFKESTGYRMFIVIGLGGTPDNPDYMYCIPLWQARHNILNVSGLKRYRRNSRRPFTWDRATHELK